jgi:hypothetical protein
MAVWIVSTALAIGLSSGLSAQTTREATSLTHSDLQPLKTRVEQRFQVLLLKQAFVLVPRSPIKGLTSIEFNDSAVLLDGSVVTGAELKQRVGADTDLLVQLSFLDSATRRQLFETAKPAPSAPAGVPPNGRGADAAPADRAAPTSGGWDEHKTVARIRNGGARFRFGSDLRIKEGEDVGSDVVVIFGSVVVDGKVNGEVVAVGGGVTLGPKADVSGDVTSVGGGIDRSATARVAGEINEVRVTVPTIRPYMHFTPWRDWQGWTMPFGPPVELAGTLIRIGVIGLLAALVVTAFPRRVRQISDQVSAEPWRAALAGLAAQVLFVPVLLLSVVVLAVSIIGIPLLLLMPFILVLALMALLVGFAGAGSAIGEIIARRSSVGAVNPLVALAVVWGLTVLGRFVGLVGSPLRVIVSVVLLCGFVVEYAAWTMGLGGVLLSRFGRRAP